MTVVDAPGSPHLNGERHDEGHTGSADHTETLEPAGTDGVGLRDLNSLSRHLLNILTSGPASSQASSETSSQTSSQTYRHPLPDPSSQPYYHPTRETYSCFLRDSNGRYYDAQVQLAFPNDEGLPIHVTIPDLGIHGIAYRTGDGPRSRQTSQSVAQANESPVEQENGQMTEVDGHLGHAGGADEGGGPVGGYDG